MRPLLPALLLCLSPLAAIAAGNDPAIAPATTSMLEVEPCLLPLPQGVGSEAAALVRIACNEHRLWHQPFIDRQGRLASLGVTEAESNMLADDGLRAWQRVAGYWQGSGALSAVAEHPGALSCGEGDNPASAAYCRAFLLDTPWSAAFISWVMRQAGIAGFPASASHINYIAAAHALPAAGPYRTADPHATRIRPGDLLCYLRERADALGHAGLMQALAAGNTAGWKSHCDLVVASNPGGNRTVYAIGGNVLNAVTLRMLPLDARGALLPLPASSQSCTPGNPAACNFNNRDWAVLLQLRAQPPAPLALPQTTP
jgi:hypothetical protein